MLIGPPEIGKHIAYNAACSYAKLNDIKFTSKVLFSDEDFNSQEEGYYQKIFFTVSKIQLKFCKNQLFIQNFVLKRYVND